MPTLHWLTKQDDVNVADKTPYKLLEEVPELSFGNPQNENMLIEGDNLEALKALLPFYAGQVQCIYIDPPYNTRSRKNTDGTNAGYDDNLEHTLWLSMMYPRLVLLRELLACGGVIFVQIDNREMHYLKIILDEIFGRKNFVTTISCKVKAPSGVASNAHPFFDCAEYILCYAKGDYVFNPLRIDSYLVGENDKKITGAYNQILESINLDTIEWMENVEDMELYRVNDFAVRTIPTRERTRQTYYENFENIYQGVKLSGSKDKKIYEKILTFSNPNDFYLYRYTPVKGKNAGKQFDAYVYKKRGLCFPKDYAYKDAERQAVVKQDIVTNLFTADWWQGLTSEGVVDFKNAKKPEKLLKMLFDIMTNPGDLILDCFLGSGTTAAVAHKMGRRYIGIEMGEHVRTHCAVRLKKVIEGEQGGISKVVNWQGGGGYRFYKLGEPIFTSDGRISEKVRFDALAGHVWFFETKTAFRGRCKNTALIGIHDGTAIALLYNGILGDRSAGGGNVLTSKTLEVLTEEIGNRKYDKLVVYGEGSKLGGEELKRHRIEFKQIPYKVQ